MNHTHLNNPSNRNGGFAVLLFIVRVFQYGSFADINSSPFNLSGPSLDDGKSCVFLWRERSHYWAARATSYWSLVHHNEERKGQCPTPNEIQLQKATRNGGNARASPGGLQAWS